MSLLSNVSTKYFHDQIVTQRFSILLSTDRTKLCLFFDSILWGSFCKLLLQPTGSLLNIEILTWLFCSFVEIYASFSLNLFIKFIIGQLPTRRIAFPFTGRFH